MTTHSRKQLVSDMYHDVFQNADPGKVPRYFASDYVQETNYDVLNYDDFVAHVESLQDGPKVSFKLEFLVETPEKVVVRTLVIEDKQIPGAPPLALLISAWEFNEQDKVCRCWEVMGED